MDLSTIWCEKYRPKTLDEIVLPQDVRTLIESYKVKESTNHLLLISSPGQGKTSLAKIIVKDVLNCDYLYINASDENGIDTIRTKIVSFAQTKALDGNGKVIILDEVDSLSGEASRALRNVMEEYAGNTRFILTANYKHRIITPIRSRCLEITFNHNIKDVVKHCFNILVKEGVKIPSEQKTTLVELIKSNFPDFRKTINELQRASISGTLDIKQTLVSNKFLQELFDLATGKDVFAARRYVIENAEVFQSDYSNLMKSLLEFIYDHPLDALKKREMLIIISEFMYRSSFVADPEINCFGCLLNLNKVV